MAAPQIATLPPGFAMDTGMVIRVTAIAAATGDVVAGVVLSEVSIDVDEAGAGDTIAPHPVTGAYTHG